MDKTKLTAREILAKARALYSRAGQDYRDHLLEVGRLLHEFLLAHLRAGDNLREQERFDRGLTRGEGIKLAATELGATPQRVNQLIVAAMVVELLGGGKELGDLGHNAVVRFRTFIQRRRGTRETTVGRPGCPPPSSLEEWEVKPGFEKKARDAFKRAVAESSGALEVARVVKTSGAANPSYLRSQPESEPPAHRHGPPHKTDREDEPSPQLQAMASVASVGDVAEMCLELIHSSRDPRAVAEKLLPELQRLKQQPKAHRSWSFAEDA